MSRIRFLGGVALAFLVAGLQPAGAAVFSAKIFAEKTNREKLMFLLKRTETARGPQTQIVSSFTYPDGKEAVHEDTLYEDGRLVKYELTLHQLNEKGSLEVKGDKIFFSYTEDGETKTDTEDWKPNLVTASTMVDYVQSQWKKILEGDDVAVRFAALDRKETVGFKLFKIDEEKVDGKNLVVVKMKPSSIFIAAIVDPLMLWFEKDTGRLVLIKGRTLPRQSVDGKWKDLDAETVVQY